MPRATSANAAVPDKPANVDAARLNNADRDAANWLSYGRTYSEQRFSPLSRIAPDNAGRMSLAGFADLDTDRGQEGTPIVIDGVLYTSTAWSMVKAYDATTGKLLWSYDPQVPRELGVKSCCDVVRRGIAVWKGAYLRCHLRRPAGRARCAHRAIGGGVVPDLRASTFLGNDFFYEIVLNGAMKDAGMAPFKAVLDQKGATAIRAYLIQRANEDKAASSK
jgi:hypothetical protein